MLYKITNCSFILRVSTVTDLLFNSLYSNSVEVFNVATTTYLTLSNGLINCFLPMF